jgi:hypothetical protein
MTRVGVIGAVGSGLIVTSGLAMGFKIGLNGFGSNVLAELIGVVAGIGVAILVVERLLDRDRRSRWRLVEVETIETLRFALVKAALTLYLHLPAPRSTTAHPYVMHKQGRLDEGLQNLTAELRDYEAEVFTSDSFRELLDSVAPYLNFVRDSVMQRLLTVGPDPELIKRLAMLESTFEDLDFHAWLDDRLKSRPGQPMRRMAKLVDSMRDVVAYIDST